MITTAYHMSGMYLHDESSQGRSISFTWPIRNLLKIEVHELSQAFPGGP